MRRLLLAPLFLLVACAGPTASDIAADPTVAPQWTVIALRHAEKTAEAGDPGLTARGEARAMALHLMLRGVEIDSVWTTDYRRTRDTVSTLAQWKGLPLQYYNPRDLEQFSIDLRMTGGVHLVVGHSNTTPQLVEALGGEPGDPISEKEYDRLYLVTGGEGTEPRTMLLHFMGEPLDAGASTDETP